MIPVDWVRTGKDPDSVELFPHPLDDIAIWTVGISLVIIAVGVIFSKVLLPLNRMILKIVRYDVPEMLKLLREVREITEELLPNSGNSVRDRVGKLLENSQHHSTWAQEQADQQEGMVRQLDEVASNVRINTHRLHEIEKNLENHRIVDHGAAAHWDNPHHDELPE